MREVPIDDVFATVLPEDMSPTDPTIPQRLTRMVQDLTWSQYTRSERPVEIHFDSVTWLITDSFEEADSFQPAHDCVACRAGQDQMEAFLREHPGRWVVLGNLHYVEVWP